jgi:GTP:adenosylcobinamide-phosphate guanylyltransferase
MAGGQFSEMEARRKKGIILIIDVPLCINVISCLTYQVVNTFILSAVNTARRTECCVMNKKSCMRQSQLATIYN